jgi:hypothetical protein
MTIFGITGIISWSLTKESNQTVSQASMSIFAKAIKLGLCIVALIILSQILIESHFGIVLHLGSGWMPGSVSTPEFWWQSKSWYAYLLSYAINILIGIPLITLICSSIYTWSVTPFKVFLRNLKER